MIGPDVSHHDRDVDWETVARTAGWATIKATEGHGFTDPRYVANAAGARKAGLPTYAYHYARADEDDAGPKEQAAHYLRVAGHLATRRAILDWEGPNLRLDPPDQARWILDWFEDAATQEAFLYCSLSTAEALHGLVTGVDLWVAYWTSPTMPQIVPDRVKALSPAWWQYTSRGTMPGIDGYADLSLDLEETTQ